MASRFSRRRFVGAGAAAVVGGVGLSRPGAAAPWVGVAGRQEASGGKLTFGIWQSPDTLDPGFGGLVASGYVMNQIFEPMIWHRPGLRPDQEYFGGLAESWEISPDATVYTFRLRPGVIFHDGTPLTAEAVKVSYDHIVDPNTKSRAAITALGPYDHTEIVDELTAKVVFKEPNGAFLNNLASPLFSLSSPTALQKYGAEYGLNPVGTGPFVFKEWVQNDHVTVVRNPDYAWSSAAVTTQGPPALEELTFRIIPDAATRVNALKTGEIDLAENLPPQDIAAFQQDDTFTLFNAPVTGMPYSIMVNAQKAPTDDLTVRQALQHAVSQEEIVEALYQGVYEPAHNIFLPPTLGYDPALDTMYPYDPERAKALLDEAGWTMNGDVREKDGQQLKLNFVNIANFGFDDISLVMQAQLQEVGIQSEISAQSFPTVGETYNKGDHHLADFFYYADDPYLMRALYACDQIESGFNWMHYCNPELDSLVQQGNATADPEQRRAIYAQAAKIVMEAAVVIPIYEQTAFFAGKQGIEGLFFSISGAPFFHDVSLTG